MKVKDHEGREFHSIAAMCEYWGVGKRTYARRIQSGWSQRDALVTAPLDRCTDGTECADHLGNRFASITEMCENYGLDLNTFQMRMKRGKSLEEALTKPIQRRGNLNSVRLETGETFQSPTEFCRVFSLSRVRVLELRKKGHSFDEILEIERAAQGRTKLAVQDHEGTLFSSKLRMCEHWGVPHYVYDWRLKNGWTQEEALTVRSSLDIGSGAGCVYGSFAALCEKYGLDPRLVKTRLRRGWCLEEALLTPVREYTWTTVVLEDGRCYRSLSEFAREIGLPETLVRAMRKAGCSFDEIVKRKAETCSSFEVDGRSALNGSTGS